MKAAIVGGGAMGSLWASLLTNGNELYIAEKDAARYDALKSRGFILFHPQGGETAKIPVTAVGNLNKLPLESLDGVILAVKSYQVDTVLAELLSLLPAAVPVLCLSNGAGFGGEGLIKRWQQENVLSELLPKLGQVFFAVSFQGAYLASPGEVYARGDGAVYWGSLPPVCNGYAPDKAAETVLETLLGAVAGCVYQKDFAGEMWQKLLVNSVINPLTALWQIPNGGLAEKMLTEERKALKRDLLQEGLAVAAAYGENILGRSEFLSPEKVKGKLEETIGATAENYSSMYQDVVHGRKTEIDFINGYLVHWGERLGVPTPWQQGVYEQIQKLCGDSQV